MSKRPYVHISVGNLNIDIVLYVPRQPGPDESVLASKIDIRPGGAATNYVVAVSYYGHKSYILASVSNHYLVKGFLRQLEEMGVNTSLVKISEGFPGLAVIIVLPNGSRSMVLFRGVNENISINQLDNKVLENAHVLHIASVEPSIAKEFLALSKSKMVITSYDPGVYAKTHRNELLKVLNYVDILFLNKTEYKELFKQRSIDDVFEKGVNLVVVKMGSKGAVVLTPGESYYGFSMPIKKPIDTTGAGDAFNAFFNSKYIESKDIGLALQYGVAAGTLKTSCYGSFMCWDPALFKAQLEKTIVERSLESRLEILNG